MAYSRKVSQSFLTIHEVISERHENSTAGVVVDIIFDHIIQFCCHNIGSSADNLLFPATCILLVTTSSLLLLLFTVVLVVVSTTIIVVVVEIKVFITTPYYFLDHFPFGIQHLETVVDQVIFFFQPHKVSETILFLIHFFGTGWPPDDVQRK
jgi:hypothetical protein